MPLLLGLFLVAWFLPLGQVLAQVDPGVEALNANMPLGNTDPRLVASRIINIALGFLGVLALGFILYAGFLWMTSGGNQDKVDKAKKILINASIGLAIILSAWAIATFVITRLIDITGAGDNNSNGNGNGNYNNGNNGEASFYIKSTNPASDSQKVPRNAVIRFYFNKTVDENTVTTDTFEVKDGAGNILAGDLSVTDKKIEFRATADCSGSSNSCNANGCLPANNSITVKATNGLDGILSVSGLDLICGGFGLPCQITFTTSDIVDCQSPEVELTLPTGQLCVDSNNQLAATATDDNWVSAIEFFVNNEFINDINNPAANSDQVNPFTGIINWGGQGYAPGDSLDFKAVAEDVDDHTGEDTKNISLKPAHCCNGIMDEGEEGVDCGGEFCISCLGQEGDNETEAPRIDYLDPTLGPSGQYFTIFGSGFGRKPGKVKFGNTLADTNFPSQCSSDYWHDNYIIVKAPQVNAGSYQISIVRTDNQESNAKSFEVCSIGNDCKLNPGICLVLPDNGPVTTPVEIFGEYFGASQGQITFTDNRQATINSWSKSQIKTSVPRGATTGPLYLFDAASQKSNGVNFSVGSCRTNNDCDSGDECCGQGTTYSGSCLPAGQCNGLANACVYQWSFTTTDKIVCDADKAPGCQEPRDDLCPANYACSSECECVPLPGLGERCDLEPEVEGCQAGECAGNLKCGSLCICEEPQDIYCDGNTDTSQCDADNTKCPSDKPYCDPNSCVCSQAKDCIYQWSFTTGSHFIVEECPDITKDGAPSPSPTPWSGRDGNNVCVNVKVSARFTESVDPNTLYNNLKVEVDCSDYKNQDDCNTKAGYYCVWNQDNKNCQVNQPLNGWTKMFSWTQKNDNGDITLSNGFNFNYGAAGPDDPAKNYSPGTKYKVTLKGGPNGVKTESGKSLAEDYIWIFETRNNEIPCEVDKVDVSPFYAKLVKQGATQDYVANPKNYKEPCLILNYDGQWQWYSEDSQKATVKDSANDNTVATAVNETVPGPPVKVFAKLGVEDKQGYGNLINEFLNFMVVEHWPDCQGGQSNNEVCVNAAIGARFNRQVDEKSFVDNVALYSCPNKSLSCNPNGLPDTKAGWTKENISYEFNDTLDRIDIYRTMIGQNGPVESPLSPDTYYRVIMKDDGEGIKNYVGETLDNANYNTNFSGWEECDDGNNKPGDGCSNLCLNEGTSACDPENKKTTNCCGNGKVEAFEDCDDNNQFAGDGCSEVCLKEGSAFNYQCGNGINDPGEDQGCDLLGGVFVGCTNNCIFKGSKAGGAVCGDGVLEKEKGEECEDTNQTNGDGCSSDCLKEKECTYGVDPNCSSAGFNLGTPSKVTCGNGVKETGEDCDDGNNKSGDGCSSICLNEGSSETCGNGEIDNAAPDSYSWLFKTKNDPALCAANSVLVEPGEKTAVVGDFVGYQSDAYSNPDNCSAKGQKLIAKFFVWYWSTSDNNKAEIQLNCQTVNGPTSDPKFDPDNYAFQPRCDGSSCVINNEEYAWLCLSNYCYDGICRGTNKVKALAKAVTNEVLIKAVIKNSNNQDIEGQGKLEITGSQVGAFCKMPDSYQYGAPPVDCPIETDICPAQYECLTGTQKDYLCDNKEDCPRCCCKPGDKFYFEDPNTPALVCEADQYPCNCSSKSADCQRGLFCGCVSDTQCETAYNNEQGCGFNDTSKCCHTRLKIDSCDPTACQKVQFTDSTTGETGYQWDCPSSGTACQSGNNSFCPNGIIKVYFDQQVDSNTLLNNFSLITLADEDGQCPANTVDGGSVNSNDFKLSYQKANFIKRSWQALARGFNRLLGRTAQAQNIKLCVVPGYIYASDIGLGGLTVTEASFVPDNVLEYSHEYYVLLAGDDTSEDSKKTAEGITSIYGVGMNLNGSWVPGNQKLSYNGQDYFAWAFTTSGSVCPIDHLDVKINDVTASSDLFNCLEDNCADDRGVNMNGNQHIYFAEALDKYNKPLRADYSWEEIDADLAIQLGDCQKYKDSNSQEKDCQPTDQYKYVTGLRQKDAYAYLKIKADDQLAGQAEKLIKINVFDCANPWPDAYNFPWQNNDYNFQFYYCRDKGKPDLYDDLPPLANPPAIPVSSSSAKILKEFLFANKFLSNLSLADSRQAAQYDSAGSTNLPTQYDDMGATNEGWVYSNKSYSYWNYDFDFPENGQYQAYAWTMSNADLKYAGIVNTVQVFIDGKFVDIFRNWAIPAWQKGTVKLGAITAGHHTVQFRWWKVNYCYSGNCLLPINYWDFYIALKEVGIEKGEATNDAVGFRVLKNSGSADSQNPTGLICSDTCQPDACQGKSENESCGTSGYCVKLYANLSPSLWYSSPCNVPNAGSPTSLTVDDYKAVRDGNSTYVDAANLAGSTIYTNIYLASYNDGANQDTADIYDQIIQHWHFNTNLKNERYCYENNVSTGEICLKDLDCSGYKSSPSATECRAPKTKITRDTIRLGDLNDMGYLLQKYYLKQLAMGGQGDYPRLEAGSYIKGMSTSKWPESWQKTTNQTSLPSQLKSSLPVDPLNVFNLPCAKGESENSNYDQNTCWSESKKYFSCPIYSKLYLYLYDSGNKDYNLYTDLEYQPADWNGLGTENWNPKLKTNFSTTDYCKVVTYSGSDIKTESLSLFSPASDEVIKKPFSFSWASVSGATSYELNLDFGQDPVTGEELKYQTTSQNNYLAVQSGDLWNKFPDGTVNWFVTANTNSGQVKSETNKFHKFFKSDAKVDSSLNSLYFSNETWSAPISFEHQAYNGVNLQRMAAQWKYLEPQNNNWTLAAADLIIKIAHQNGIRLMLSLHDPPSWALEGNSGDLKLKYPEGYNEYVEYVEKIVKRYKPGEELAKELGWQDGYGVTMFEIWNEPNLKEFWGRTIKEYADLLKMAQPAIKKECPSCLVLNGGWFWKEGLESSGSGVSATTAVKEFYDAGAKSFFDLMAFHPYPDQSEGDPLITGEMYNRIDSLSSIMDSYNDNSGIFANEFGFSYSGLDKDKQAVYDLTTVAEMSRNNRLAGVSLFNYNSTDNSLNNKNYWAGMSFVEGGLTNNLVNKTSFVIIAENPVFTAYGLQAKLLQGSSFSSKKDFGATVEYLFNYPSNKKVYMVRAKSNISSDYSLVNGGFYDVYYSLSGLTNKKKMAPFTIKVTTEPVFIVQL